jgi:MscS family membrane protein
MINNSLSDYLIAISLIIVSILLSKLLYNVVYNFIEKHTPKNTFPEILIKLLKEPLLFALIILGIWYSLKTLNFSDSGEKFISTVYYLLITFDIAWFVVRFIDSVIERYIVPFTKETETKLDDQLLPLVRKAIKALIWILAILVALNNAGYDVGAIVASLGIGGLAFALAAKDTLANFFGSITIFLDEPFAIGDRVKIDKYEGYVEEIGLRSTRVRLLNGRVVTIANSIIVNTPIENVSSEPSRKIAITLGLVYSTTYEQIQKAMQILEDIVKKCDLVEDEAVTSFINFNSSSLDIKLIYYIKPSSCIFKAQSCINLEILKNFEQEGLEFAYPTQTLYMQKG